MIKHKIANTYKESDAAGNTVYVLECSCGKWKDKSFNESTLVGSYQHHVMTERKKEQNNA